MKIRTFRVKPKNQAAVLAAMANAGIDAAACEAPTTWMGGFFGVDHHFNPATGMVGVKVRGSTRRKIDAAFRSAKTSQPCQLSN